MKFSVLNEDFNSPSLEPLFKETCARGCSTGYTRWTIFFFLCSAFFVTFFFFARIFRCFVRIFHRDLPESGEGRPPSRPPGSYAHGLNFNNSGLIIFPEYFYRRWFIDNSISQATIEDEVSLFQCGLAVVRGYFYQGCIKPVELLQMLLGS